MYFEVGFFIRLLSHVKNEDLLMIRLDYQPLFGKMSPHSSPERGGGEDQRPDPGDGGNRAYLMISLPFLQTPITSAAVLPVLLKPL